ncbi:hypothetical protein E2C01_083353 [Portunus trituberculatus]|uniref:Uncharacterized protein n=1 Tax=Portunus trituberculatus TaxID=210409 RepID=A0A5B7IUX6_PORTR|nr:hypothetical protein [Portunus trituberculatus]
MELLALLSFTASPSPKSPSLERPITERILKVNKATKSVEPYLALCLLQLDGYTQMRVLVLANYAQSHVGVMYIEINAAYSTLSRGKWEW